jgi:hypothetical protein
MILKLIRIKDRFIPGQIKTGLVLFTVIPSQVEAISNIFFVKGSSGFSRWIYSVSIDLVNAIKHHNTAYLSRLSSSDKKGSSDKWLPASLEDLLK